MHHNKTASTTTSTSATTVATTRLPSTTRVATTRVASTILYFGFDFFRMPSLWLIDTPKGLPCMATTEATTSSGAPPPAATANAASGVNSTATGPHESIPITDFNKHSIAGIIHK